MKKTKRLLLLLIAAVFLSGICAANADMTRDTAFVNDFIASFVPKDAEEIPSDFFSNAMEIKGNTPDSLAKNIQTDVRTYAAQSADDGEMRYQSVFVMKIEDRISMTDKDFLEVTANDYLRPYSPETDAAWLFARDDAASDWQLVRTLTPYATGSGVRIFGSELRGNFQQSMVILYFPSSENPETASPLPFYNVLFLHAEREFPLWPCGIAAVIIAAAIFVSVRKKRHAR